MIDEKTTASTAEICLLAALTPQRLSQVEREGVVQRAGRDEWPLVATVRRLFDDARSRRTASAARLRWEEARAEMEQLKVQQRRGELCRLEDAAALLEETLGSLMSDLDALPARFTRDLSERRRLDALIVEARNNWARRLRELRQTQGPRDDAREARA